ncbi:hypothetical protein PNEG_03382 [Pneumocystis murina B123]|uniref:Eukaryotic peptide chain release factor GTP-binding subunit n=1 Tax=Pneumocystis murina (strain B123) TaxID=1069680 RepID=M7NI28_PNEMU|nr:hypothetical protein PNEG_03382 [Pneumocystis murina B123]EMR08213.1 hypothetical protein PNEG_03382 [Pneumocystis murina B123]
MSSEAKNVDVDDTWEERIDQEEILEKIGKLRMSAEAEEFRPRNLYYEPQDFSANYDINNVPYGYFNMSYDQNYDRRKYHPYNNDYSARDRDIRLCEKVLAPPEVKVSTLGGQRTTSKVIKIGECSKTPFSEESVVGRNGNKINKVDKGFCSVDMENLSLGASKQEKNHVSVGGDEERRDYDIVSQFQEEIDEEVLQDMYGKEHLNVVFIGHVDAGKSTLGGNILYITEMVDKRTMEKYEKDAKEAGRESWYLSWALDSTKEERSKGKTVELGRAYFETEKRRYTILDAPGHKSYVPNMIEGTAQADVAVLVISARKGEYETGFEKGGQTREHAMLSKTQGVSKLVVVINKMDDPTVEWSKERYDECTNGISMFLRKEVGYNPKTDFVFMPISAFTGVNIKERIDKKICPWYNGPSLLEYLDEMDTFERKVNAPLIIPIHAKYKDMGLVIEGKVESGYVKKGSNVILMPNKTVVEVIALYDELEEIRIGRCGEQVKLRIRGVEEEDVMTGHILSSLNSPVSTAKIFEAQIAILEVKNLLTAGYSCIIHIHSAVQEVTFLKLLYKLDKLTNRRSKKPPAFAIKGMKIVALLEAASPLCLETFDKYRQLGRFILRNEGLTVAIGKVTKLISEE